MEMENDQSTQLIADARKWAQSDRSDPYRQHLLGAVLHHGGKDALEELQTEMKRNP